LAISLRSIGASPGANSTTCVITKPAGLALGDFMLAHVVFKATSGTIALSGWTIVGAQSNTASSRSAVLWKIAVQADVDATTFTFTSATGRNRGEVSAWTGVDPISPINVADQQINAAGTSIAVPTPTVTNSCLVLIVGSNAAGGTASACSGSDPTATITLGYAVAYSTYCALAIFSGVKSGTDAIDAHSLSTFTSAVSSGHAIALNPTAIAFVTAEGNETQLSDTSPLTQTHILTVTESYQTELSDAPALTQEHTLSVTEGMQTQLSDQATITEESAAIDLVPDEGMQVEISDAPALTQVHALIIAEGTQTQLSDASVLTQEHQLIAAEGNQTQASDSPMLTQTHILTAAEGVQIQISDTSVLSQEHQLAVDEDAQIQISDGQALTQEHQLAAAEGYQLQTGDVPTVSQEHQLAAQEGSQVQTSDGAALEVVGAIDLIPVEAVQIQIADTPVISQEHYLTAQEGAQTQVSDEATLSGATIDLVTAEGVQIQVSDAALLDLIICLAVQEGQQEQFSDVLDYLIVETRQVLAFIPERGQTIKPVILTHRNAAQAVTSHRRPRRWIKGTGIPAQED